jgi:hypothetical protein
MNEYATQILPKIRNKMDDLMTAYYANEGRMAGAAISESGPGDINIKFG